jgi:hypothetical protein
MEKGFRNLGVIMNLRPLLTCRCRTGVARLVLGLAALPLLSAPILAQSCQDDMKKLVERRMAIIGSLNTLNKTSKAKLDPITACPKIKSLAAVEGELVAFMTKNKDWCSFGDETIAQLEATRGKTSTLAGQACAVAAKAKKMQQQEAAAAAQGQQQQQPQIKLPAGPL